MQELSTSNVVDPNLIDQRHIVVGDVLHEILVWIEKHNMEMLHCMNGLQTGPILEPDAVFRANSCSESLLNIRVDLFSGRIGQIAGNRIFFERKFDPNNEMHDSCVDTIRPVVEQDFDIV